MRNDVCGNLNTPTSCYLAVVMREMLTAMPTCHAFCFPMQRPGTSCAATVGLPDTDAHATHPGAGP
eukprot:14748436-Alexandrium_andersonii.AAC.1